MNNWKTEKLAKTYLEGVRGAIPFANEQIEILLRIIKRYQLNLNSFLDLGCGDGVLGRTLYNYWPDAKGIFVDFSKPMIEAAKLKSGEYKNQSVFIVEDFGNENWLNSISEYFPLDLVISGFSIHHQDNENKRRLFNEIYNKILKPGGLFLNLDQVKSQSEENEKIFDEFFLDSMKKSVKDNILMENITNEYYKDKKVNILAPVEDQCKWLREIGFVNVDCYFKVFELAIFGGVKP